MENSIYTVDWFINKFQQIPEEKFCSYSFRRGIQRCFVGHTMPDHMIDRVLSVGISDYGNYSKYRFTDGELQNEMAETKALCDLISDFAKGEGRYDEKCLGITVAYEINNGRHPNFQQPTHKQRILSALSAIKAKQQPTPEPIEVKTVYVTVDEKVRELQMKENIFQN